MSHHISGIDFDYVGAFLFESTATDPQDMINQGSPYDGLADAPPPISGYRDANVAGMACWNCGHFTAVDDNDNDGVVDGICNLFEAKADGEATCDRFTAHPDLYRQSPHTSWQEDLSNAQQDQRMGAGVESVNYSDTSSLNEIRFSSPAVEEDSLVWKDILRTGEWSSMPTNKGVIQKKLRIIDEGESDPDNGVISLSELEQNFNDGAVPYVTVPLSDDERDHKNIARLNTGLIKALKRIRKDGKTFLRAGIDFTEPDIKEKVLRGTIPDGSAGVPFGVTRRKDNKVFRTVLDHFALSKKPFIDGLGPFGLAAADEEVELQVENWEEGELAPEPTKPQSETIPNLSFQAQRKLIQTALSDQLHLGVSDYEVEDINPDSTATIRHRTSKVIWNAPFKMTADGVRLASADKWKIKEEESEPTPSVPATVAAADELRAAHELRELRLAQPNATGGIEMSVSAPLSLDGVELSDEQRQRIQGLVSENEELRRRNREAGVATRIAELEALGLKERPGALKLYREVMLSDDGGPAIVLFSDSEDEQKKERLTALQILDRFITAMRADGGVELSDQASFSGNDIKPPTDASGEKDDLDKRVEDAEKALYGDKNRRNRRRNRNQQK